jgi:hypothetical protein
MRYAAGIAAAVAAGIADHVGILIQKSAVGRTLKGPRLMRSLLKSPRWLSGLALQFFMGVPLNVASISLIGPAIVPGLMSIGLVVLALGAILVQKERVRPREIAGIAFVILAVIAFGLSRLSIDVHAVSMSDPALLSRAGAFAGALAAMAILCTQIARRIASGPGGQSAAAPPAAGAMGAALVSSAAAARRDESAAALHAARAGLLYNLGNLGVGFITAGLARFRSGIFVPAEMIVFLIAVALAWAGSLLGLSATQHALAYGRAAIAIPLQNGVAQILPVFVFFLVYRPYVPVFESFVFLGAAGALLIAGAILLTSRLRAENSLTMPPGGT